MANNENNIHECFYEEWITLQKQELSDLQDAVRRNAEEDNDNKNAESLQLVEKIMEHFQDYVEKRNCMIRLDVSPYFAPPWCSSLENSLFWIAGCRPSAFIRLVYALCGLDIESELSKFLQGAKVGNIGELSGTQLSLIDKLQKQTIAEERRLSERKAVLEEDIVDNPLTAIAKKCDTDCESSRNAASETLEKHGQAMAAIIDEADKLRLKTLKEIISIFTPLQSVDFLAASKKFRLCIKEWGKKYDEEHGRN